MLENLSTAGMQRLTAELAQGRIETLLRIGQVQTATVVDVVPQPARQSSAQPQNTTSQVRQGAEASQTNADNKPAASQLVYGKPQRTTSTNATPQPSSTSNTAPPSTKAATSNNSATINNSTTTNASQNQAYRTKINLEGKLIDIITPTPLKPGSQINLSRNAQNQLVISTAQTSGTAPNAAATAASNTQAALTLPIKPGETSNAKVIQSRGENSSNTPTNTRPSTSTAPSNTAPSNTAPSPQARTVQPAASNLTATSVSTSSGATTAASYVTTINIKGTAVDVLTSRPIPAGTEVKVSLDKAGNATVQLPAPARLAADQSLREHLPQQQPISQLLNLLQDPALSQQVARSQPMITGLLQLILGRSLSTPQQTDAQQLRQQFQDSGTQMENKLARQDSQGLKNDSKALLLQLQNRLANASGSMPANSGQRISEMTQQAISRVLVNQLTSLSQQVNETEGDRTRTLVTDIPVAWQQQTENLRIQVSQRQPSEADPNDPSQTRWQVQLHFEMESMPPMQAQLTLQGEQISVLFFGNEATQTLVSPQLDKLKTALEDVGLEVDMLQVREQGLVNTVAVQSHSPLIDIKT